MFVHRPPPDFATDMLGPLQRLRSLLLPPDTQAQAGYTPIATDPDAPADLALDTERGTRPRQGRDVYLCFWVLGAGVLLPWNGELIDEGHSVASDLSTRMKGGGEGEGSGRREGYGHVIVLRWRRKWLGRTGRTR